jgi:NTE family protein
MRIAVRLHRRFGRMNSRSGWAAGWMLFGVLCASLVPSSATLAQAQTPAPIATEHAAAAAAPIPAPAVRPGRPRVALVLSGGGARGFAHIGVLRVLHEARVPVDIVWGTSMGAVVGGAYAAGRSPDELLAIVRTTDWDAVLADRPPRDTLSHRRREEDLALPSRLEFALGRDGLSLPPATAGNAVLELALARLLPEGLHDRLSRSLPIPFGSVASDLLTGELVDQSGTPVFQALRASLSVPGVFSPVRVQGRLLVDGGLVRNLPVDLARTAGADVVIAVNVGTPLGGENELGSSLGVARQMLGILTEQNVMRSLAELTPRDILIAPDLSGVSFMDFNASAKAIAVGEAAARQMLGRLQALALPEPVYAAHLAARQLQREAAAPVARLPLGRLSIDGEQRLNERTLVARTGLVPGQPVSTQQVHEAAARLQGHGDLSRVDVSVQDADGQRNVQLQVTESTWSRSRLRLGLELASDFEDASSFSVAAMHVAAPLNTWGTELRTVARIGTRRSLDLQLWQPLGPTSPWSGTFGLQHLSGPQDIFEGERRLGRLYVRNTELSLGLAREIGAAGELRLGVARSMSRIRTLLPVESAGASGFDRQLLVGLRSDTLDSVGFPTQGHVTDIVWRTPLGAREGDAPRNSRVQGVGLWAFRGGVWSGHVYVEGARAREGLAPRALGGFWRLTGTEPESLWGRSLVFGRWVLARDWVALAPALGRAVRGGFSVEMGGAFASGVPVRLDGMKTAGSVFLSADTRLGPLYLGVGGTQGSQPRMYLFLGPIW